MNSFPYLSPHNIISPSSHLSSNFIPKYIHRTLLYDDNFPSNIQNYLLQFHSHYPQYSVVVWRDQDIKNLLSPSECKIYDQMINIQKSDLARYLILYHYGGIYADFDIESYQSLDSFIQQINQNEQKDGIVFIEHIHRLNKQCQSFKKFKIRQNTPEHKIRIANYLMIFKPHSSFLHQCIQLVYQRSHLPIEVDYDILYTTGPDVVSTVYATFSKNSLHTISLSESLDYFIHKCAGHWRKHR